MSKQTRNLARDLFRLKQLSLPIFSSSPINLVHPVEEKVAVKRRASVKKLFMARQLSLPLLNDLPEAVFKKATLEDLDNNPNLWNEEQRIMAHGILLWESLHALGRIGQEAEKVDVLCWIFTDEDKRFKQYSFDVCCEMYGYNADSIRGLIEDRLAELKKGLAREKLCAMVDQLKTVRTVFKRLGAMKLAG